MSYFSKSLKRNLNKEFKVNMIQNLDLVINIEESLFGLRNELKDVENPMFDSLFDIWLSDPISCISLCLLGQR